MTNYKAMTKDNYVVCKCGAYIPDENIEFTFGQSEEGEDHRHVEANCPVCGAEYFVGEWGEWEDFDEAKDSLQDYINQNQ